MGIEWEIATPVPDSVVEILHTLEMAFTRHDVPLERVYYRIAPPSETETGVFMFHLYNLKGVEKAIDPREDRNVYAD